MQDVNSVVISGRLGKDPEMRVTPQGMAVMNFSVCSNSRAKVQGTWEDKPNWINCVIFGKQAEFLEKHMVKGTRVHVQGRLSEATWQEQGGKHRSRIEILGDVVLAEPNGTQNSQPSSQTAALNDYADEEIPF